MAEPALKLDTELNINLRKLDRDIANIGRRLNKSTTISIDDKASLPLGRITGLAKDFDRSLNAATQRVVAFGAAAAVFNVLQNSFTELVKSVINVEDSLAKINVNLGQSKQQIQGFASEVFKAAKDTGKTFEEAAKGAEELARQGLGAEETISRLNSALILSRLAGIDTTAAVESLTAAVNSFSSEAVTASEVLNKFVAVDTRFAVSTRDLQEAISRVGSTASEAGVSLDELNGIVTAVQQTTARGGSVIGNAFKTIFTRIARPETLKQLEDLGIAVKDLEGNALPAIQILKNLALAQDGLSQAQQQTVKEQVAGTLQINILNAALGDLAKSYSVSERAQKASSQATDEANQKNAKLNETLKSQINALGQSFTQLSSKIGEAGTGNLFGFILGQLNDVLSQLTETDSSKAGESIADGLIKGISNVLTGPGLVVALGAITKAISLVTTAISKDIKGLLDLSGAGQKRLDTQNKLNAVLAQATNEERENLAAVTSIADKKAQILAISQRIAAVEGRSTVQNQQLVGALINTPSFRKGGFAPNFAADPISDAISREKKAGVNPKDIYVGQDSRLKSPSNPMGLLVANRRDEPFSGSQGVDRAIAEGRNPKSYKGGNAVVPNFAESKVRIKTGRGNESRFATTEQKQEIQNAIDLYKKGLSDAANGLSRQGKEARKAAEILLGNIGIVGGYSKTLDQLDQEYKNGIASQKAATKIEKQTLNNYKKAASNGTLFQETPSSLQSLPTAIIRGGSKAAPGAFAATQQQSSGTSSIVFSDKAFQKQQIQAASVSLQKERITEAVRDTLQRVQAGIIPTPTELKRIQDVASRQVLRDPEFQGISKLSIVRGTAAKPIVELYKSRVREQLSTFNNNLERAQEIATQKLNDGNFLKAQSRLGDRGNFFNLFNPSFIAKRRKEGVPFLEGRKRDEAILKKSGIDSSGQDIQNLINSREDKRQSRISSATLGLSFIAPLLAGFIPQGKGGTASGIAGAVGSNALNFGSAGATVGSFFGPVGAGVGAGIGVAAGVTKGLFDKLNKSAEELNGEFEQVNDKERARVQSIEQYIQIQEQLNQAIKDGASKGVVDRFKNKLGGIRSGLDSGTLKSLDGLGDNIEKLGEFADKQDRAFGDTQRQQAAAVRLLETVGQKSSFDLRGLGGIGKFLDTGFNNRIGFAGSLTNITPGLGLPDEQKVNSLSNLLSPLLKENPELAKTFRDQRSKLTGADSKPLEESLLSANAVIEKLRNSSKEFAGFGDASATNILELADAFVQASISADKASKATKDFAIADEKKARDAKTRSQIGLFSGGSLTGQFDPFVGFGGALSNARNLQRNGAGNASKNPLSNESFLGALDSLKSLNITDSEGKASSTLGLGKDAEALNKRIEEITKISTALVNQEKAYRVAANLILAAGPSEGLTNLTGIFDQFGKVNKTATDKLLESLKKSKDDRLKLIAELISAALQSNKEGVDKTIPKPTSAPRYSGFAYGDAPKSGGIATRGELPKTNSPRNPDSKIYFGEPPADFGSTVNISGKAGTKKAVDVDQDIKRQKTLANQSAARNEKFLDSNAQANKLSEEMKSILKDLGQVISAGLADRDSAKTSVTIDITNNGKVVATLENTVKEVEGLKISVAQQNGKPLPPKTPPKAVSSFGADAKYNQ